MELRWWILSGALLLLTAVWWRMSRSAHLRRGLPAPAARPEDS
ncbi:hypothetical protein ACIBXA_03085 [Micromonospora echinaurantiaca]|nr:hypothetical protein [Micromonospora sp. S4605]